MTPIMMLRPCSSSSRLLRTFFKSHNFFIMEKWPVSEIFDVKFESLKFQQFYLMKFEFFQSFKFDLKYFWNRSFFHYEKTMRLKKVLSNLEPEGAWHYHGSDTPASPRAILLHSSLLGAIKLWDTLHCSLCTVQHSSTSLCYIDSTYLLRYLNI